MRKGKAKGPRWFLSNRRAMLDLSDEEPEAEWVRRQNPVARSIFKSKGRFFRSVAPGAKLLAAAELGIPPQLNGPLRSPLEVPVISFLSKNKKEVSGFAAEHQSHPDSFYKSMKPLVFLAQLLGVFPVCGVSGPDYKSLSFKWIHYKTVYWALGLASFMFAAVCSVIHSLRYGTFAQAAGGIAFFVCAVISSLLMLDLARNWRMMNREFVRAELKLKKYGYPKGTRFRFTLFTAFALTVALVEHVLRKAKNLEVAVQCARSKDNLFDLLESFFIHEYIEVFYIYSYSLWKVGLVLVFHFLATANWNVKDLFLCLISWSIAERFKQVRDSLDKVQGEERPVSFWKEIREDYNNISLLTKRIDRHVQKLMLLSIGSNLFFICIQLFNTLKKGIDSIQVFYFFWSFGLLVIRTGFVAFSAARINDESKEPKSVLYSVPQNSYSAEVRRFLTQLTTNDVAFTGSGFFSVTRSLILTITGTVITYEIVLVQFSGSETEGETKTNHTTCLN